jgi:outer membrane protein
MKIYAKLLAIGVATLLSHNTMAQSAGTWMGRIGTTTLTPEVSGGVLSAPSLPNSKTDVGAASQLSGGITYMYTDNISVDLPLAFPFTHQIYGAGALQGVGKVAQVDALPASIFFQYRFGEANSTIRPYVGLGATYAYFFNAKGNAALTATTNPGGSPTTLTIDSQFIVTPQIGLTVALSEKMFVDVVYTKSTLKTTTKLSTGQTADVNLDPSSISLTIGMKF